jgi:hypothetical protein
MNGALARAATSPMAMDGTRGRGSVRRDSRQQQQPPEQFASGRQFQTQTVAVAKLVTVAKGRSSISDV